MNIEPHEPVAGDDRVYAVAGCSDRNGFHAPFVEATEAGARRLLKFNRGDLRQGDWPFQGDVKCLCRVVGPSLTPVHIGRPLHISVTKVDADVQVVISTTEV